MPQLLPKAGVNVALVYDQALKLHQQGRLQEAEPLYAQVLSARPDHVDATHMMGVIKLAKGQPAEALQFIAAAMRARKPTPTMLYNQGLALKALARPDDALASFDQAIKMKSKFAEAHNERGAALAALGRHEEAITAYQKAGAARADFAEAHCNRGISLLALGRNDDALKATERALALDPKHAKAHNNRGALLGMLGRHEEALLSYERAIICDPGLVKAHNNRSQTLFVLNRIDEALAVLDGVQSQWPDNAEASSNRGMCLFALGRYEEALAAIEHAIVLDPKFVKALNDRGVLLVTFSRYEEALASYDQALVIDPNFLQAINNRARVLFLLDRFNEALSYLEMTLAQRPDNADAYFTRGRVQLELNRNAEAAADFERSLALRPGNADARFASCFAELSIVYSNESEVDARRAAYEQKLLALSADVESGTLDGVAAAITNRQPFYLAYQGRNDRNLQAIYGGMVSRIIARQFSAAPLPPPPAPGEPIRVGIVSSFFFQHSNWKMPIKGWLSQLDRSRFKIYGYHIAAHRDTVTDVAANLCDRFVHRTLDIAGWRREILADSTACPDLSRHPDGCNFVQLAAQRLAPVQCNSWGHPETSGMPTLDYFLSSDLMEPPEAAEHYTERLVRLPNLSVYYEPVDAAPVTLTRQQFGLRPDAPVFWSGQSIYKYLPQFDDVFPRIAKQAPTSQFAFLRHNGGTRVTEVFQARLDRAFAAHGLSASDYCVYIDQLKQGEFIAAMGLCDVFLDSIGWSGCNSTLESLPHNLPIVTQPGKLMRGRHSAAILQMMGVTETIAGTLDDYVTIAARLANNPQERQAISRRIAENKQRVYRDPACIAALQDFLEQAVRGTALN